MNNPTRSGYSFIGWNEENTLLLEKEGSEIPRTDSVYYGPYYQVPAGYYRFEIYGSNLTNASFNAYENNSSNVVVYDTWVSSTRAVVYIFVKNNLTGSGLEVTVSRGSNVRVIKEELSALKTTMTIPTGSNGAKHFEANWLGMYYLDLNGRLDGSDNGGISGYGTADVYINGSQVADDVVDYCTQWPTGTTYEIKDIKASSGKGYIGVISGSLTGTIRTTGVGVKLGFNTANYTISAGSPAYHKTLKDAVSTCTAGGTITANTNTTESDSITINKNITINTNGKTLTRTDGIITISAGTTTISGNGGISHTKATQSSEYIPIQVTGGTFATTGGTSGPTITSKNDTIKMYNSSVLSLAGGYISTTSTYTHTALTVNGTGEGTVNNTYIYGASTGGGGCALSWQSTGTINVKGSSVIGTDQTAYHWNCFVVGKKCTINISGSAQILAGANTSRALGIDAAGMTINLTESCSLYGVSTSNNQGMCIHAGENCNNGVLTINTSGYIYAGYNECICTYGGTGRGTLNLQKGHFCSGTTRIIAWASDWNDTYYQSGPGDRSFNKMTGAKSVGSQTLSNRYYYEK